MDEAEKTPRVRLVLTMSKTTIEWLESEAMRQTMACGGTVRQGGAGMVTISQVCEFVIQQEMKRLALIPHRRKAPLPDDTDEYAPPVTIE